MSHTINHLHAFGCLQILVCYWFYFSYLNVIYNAILFFAKSLLYTCLLLLKQRKFFLLCLLYAFQRDTLPCMTNMFLLEGLFFYITFHCDMFLYHKKCSNKNDLTKKKYMSSGLDFTFLWNFPYSKQEIIKGLQLCKIV